EILPQDRLLPEVLAKVRGVGAAAAVADDERGLPLLVAGVNRVRQRVDLCGVELAEFLADLFQEGVNVQLNPQHFLRPPASGRLQRVANLGYNISNCIEKDRAMPRDLILGTAGHIDHGKTSLVKALTGIDCDRLPEEKARGITIDIGFATLDLGEFRLGI